MFAPVDRIAKTLSPGSVIADFGCGDGFLLASLQDPEKGFKLLGFDKTTPTLPPSDVQFRECDLSLPFEINSNSVDLSISSHVIEHLNNPLDYFSEIVRVTKVGGFIVVLAPSDRSTWFSCPISQERNLTPPRTKSPTSTGGGMAAGSR